MGKAPKRVRILLTDPVMEEWDLVKKWKEQGHEIEVMHPGRYDLILGPDCWQMTKALEKYLPQALTAARGRRYGNKEDNAKQPASKTDDAQDEVRATETPAP